MNLSNLSDSDLMALKENRISDISDAGLKQMRADYAQRSGEADFQKSVNPTLGMSTREKVLAGMGSSFADVALGVRQRLGNASEQDVTDKRAIDKPLLETTPGRVGSALGSVASATGLSLLPGANSYLGAAAGGALYGAIKPTTGTESVLSNAIGDSALNVGGLAAGRALFGGLAGNANTPARQNLVDTAVNKYKIPLPASARTGNNFLGYLESTVAGMPGGGKMDAALQNAKQAFTGRVMEQAGAPAGAQATTAEFDMAKKGVQDAYKAFWNGRSIDLDGQFVQDIVAAQNAAGRMLTPEKQAVVQKQIQNILSKVQNGQIRGDVYQMGLRPELRSVATGDSSLKEPLRMIQRALDDVANRSVGPADAEALAKLNRQYAVGKSIEPVIPKAEARGGTLAPNEALSKIGGFSGDAGELGRIGPLLRDMPNSGTAQRQLAMQLLTAGGLGGVGGGAGYLAGGPEGAVYGALAGILGPAVAAQVLGSKLGQNALARGVIPARQSANALANTAVRPLALGAPALPMLIPAEQ